MDLLSVVLQELRLQSASYRTLELHAPWRLRFDGGLRGVHVVVEGSCLLTLDGQRPRPLSVGDLVVLPRADSHELVSTDGVPGRARSSLELAKATVGNHIVVTGSGPVTRLVCGAFFFADDNHPAVAGFADCIVVPGKGTASAWLVGLTSALIAEATEAGPGSDVVMARLSDALVTRAMRHHLETAQEPGWLRGLRDPYAARALAAIHDDVAAPWTLQSLAQVAGLSRSAFAERFTRMVGETPMAYVYRYRMRTAAALIRGGPSTIARVATRVGYGSESAFAAAFSRYAGVSPGRYRRDHAAATHDRYALRI